MKSERELMREKLKDIREYESYDIVTQWYSGLIAVWQKNRLVYPPVNAWSILTNLEGVNISSGRVVDIFTGETYHNPQS